MKLYKVTGTDKQATSEEITDLMTQTNCGLANVASSTVTNVGTSVTMTFYLALQKERSPKCTANGLSLTSLALTSGRNTGAVVGQGKDPTPTIDGNQVEHSASNVLSDGATSSGSGINMGSFFLILLALLALAGGYKFWKDKQGKNEPPPPPTMEGGGGGYPMAAAEMSRPPAPMPAGAGALPPGWVEAQDPGSGMTYYVNQFNGMTSWTRPME